MSDENLFHSPEEGQSIDELIAETKHQIGAMNDVPEEDAAPAGADFPPEDSQVFDGPYGDAPGAGSPEEDDSEAYPEDDYPDEAYPEGDYLDEEYLEDGLPPEKPRRKYTHRIVPLLVKVLLYLLIAGIAAIGLGLGIWECAQDVMAFGRADDALTVTIEEGDTLDDIAAMLKEHGVIKYPWLFKFYCKFTDSADDMDPGTYQLQYNYDYHALTRGMMATSVNRSEVRVTIPEGMTSAKIFELMEKNNVCTADELAACAAGTEFDYWFLADVPYGRENRLEGFLFPDTYDFYENDDPERVLDKLLTNFNRKFSDVAQTQLEALNDLLAERLRGAGFDDGYIASHRLSVYDLVTVASMVERETAGADESALIAAVIYNRLCDPENFPYLNIDATVVYALGGVDHPLTYEDTQVDSPYNTYRNTGLPAGPIANPGLSSISAALNPSDDGYYYYALNKETGRHHFSETYDEHNAFLEGQNSGEE